MMRSHPTQAQLAANRANAQRSTGPTTEAGKATSSQNRRSYGLTGEFVVLGTEDENEYQAMFRALIQEYRPATPTEQLLVKKMSQHQWLADRALYHASQLFLRRQFSSLRKTGFAVHALSHMHNRAFHKALTELQKTQKERQQQELGVPRLKVQSLEANLLLKQNKLKRLQPNGFESKNPAEPQTTTPPTTPESQNPTQTEPASVSEHSPAREEHPAAA